MLKMFQVETRDFKVLFQLWKRVPAELMSVSRHKSRERFVFVQKVRAGLEVIPKAAFLTKPAALTGDSQGFG